MDQLTRAAPAADDSSRQGKLALFVAVVWCAFVWLFGTAVLGAINTGPIGASYRAEWSGP